MVLPKLFMLDSSSISFNPWISRGCEDIFDLIGHGVDRDFKNSRGHLAPIQCNSTGGDSLFELLTDQLEKFGLTRNILQKCVTWAKKSAKDRKGWTDACQYLGFNARIIPTPVKTRFVSVLVMLKIMLSDKEVVRNCFGTRTNRSLRSRVPSPETW